MYLRDLPDCAKQGVLDLAFMIALEDGTYCEEEKELIKTYQHEMNFCCEPSKKALVEIIPLFSDLSMVDKKKIIFELVRLVIIDGTYSDEEKQILEDVTAKFDIPVSFIMDALVIINDLNVLYSVASQLVLG